MVAIKSDVDSLTDLQKIEPPERPDYDQLMAYCHGQFSKRWVKYMYAKFKNECPTGRMKLAEFKKLLGVYVPDRISDAYLERMFNAICYNSPKRDQITFKDLIECLSLLYMEDGRTHAEWTMRLINGRLDRVYFPEFNEFVKSVFMLVGREQMKRNNSVVLDCVDESTYHEISRRAMLIFKELDVHNQGYLTVEELEKYFSMKEPKKIRQ
uniref:EF-hand domain-containing protein n=1 Tax=Acrobeloides nanus TaxID=290746 RepID=A0A914EJL7_9BILA